MSWCLSQKSFFFHASVLKVSDWLGQRHQRGLPTRRQTRRLCRRGDKHVAQLPLERSVSRFGHIRSSCDAGHWRRRRRCIDNDACTRFRFWPIHGCARRRIARAGRRRVDDECECWWCWWRWRCQRQVRSDVSQVRKVRARLSGDDEEARRLRKDVGRREGTAGWQQLWLRGRLEQNGQVDRRKLRRRGEGVHSAQRLVGEAHLRNVLESKAVRDAVARLEVLGLLPGAGRRRRPESRARLGSGAWRADVRCDRSVDADFDVECRRTRGTLAGLKKRKRKV